MAIGTNSAIDFFGTQDDLDSTSALVASNAFSIASDLVTWTNDDDAKEAAYYVTGKNGGQGAVREICEMILKAQSK